MQSHWHRLGFSRRQQGLVVTSLDSGPGLLGPNAGFITWVTMSKVLGAMSGWGGSYTLYALTFVKSQLELWKCFLFSKLIHLCTQQACAIHRRE